MLERFRERASIFTTEGVERVWARSPAWTRLDWDWAQENFRTACSGASDAGSGREKVEGTGP